jgi:hypothetical protein
LVVAPLNAYGIDIPVYFFDEYDLFVAPSVGSFMPGAVKLVHDGGDKGKVFWCYINLSPQGFPLTVTG